jgi:DNA repair exonuclease SbcCD ATPase subunit
MRITRLRLADFKGHDELEIEPAAGLTIVRGPNEAGKSSIAQAIELALFRKPDSNREDVRRAWAWGATEPPTVELDFEVDGVQGTLRKRFAAGSASGELHLDGQAITDYARIGDELAELIGVPSEGFFGATASVGHNELAAVAGDEPAISDRLQKAISGHSQGTAKAKRKLGTAIHRYRTEGHKNPGLLKASRAEIARLERELAEGEDALGRLEADRAAWVEADERQRELDRRLGREQADLAEAERAVSLATARDAAQARYERLRRGCELTERSDELRRSLPTELPAASLREAIARAQALEFELSELEAELDTAVEATAAEAPPELPRGPLPWLGAAALIVIVGWLALFLLGSLVLVALVVLAVAALGVALTLGQAFRLARRRRQAGLARALAESAVAERQAHERELEDRDRRARRELEGLLGSLGVTDLEAARSMLAVVEEHAQALAEIEGELRGLGVQETNARRLQEARDQAANEAAQAAHAMAAMGGLAEDPGARRAALQRQVEQTGPARDAARSEADRAQGRVDANQVDADIVAGLAERLAAERERLAELESRLLVYESTLAAIEAAEEATLKTAARYLEEHMGPTVAEITDGRYDDVEVDERSLAMRVRAPETGELVDVGELSQGTADQLYLAARLGLVRLVTLDRRPPLILDDPFVTFDPARGERALRLVRRFAHEHGFQVVYLTCSDRFDKLADALVVLPPPTGERVLAQPRPAEPLARLPTEAVERPAPPAPPAPLASTLAGATAGPAGPTAGTAEPAARIPDAPSPTMRFAPDPRRNPDVNAPRRAPAEEVDEPLTLFAQERMTADENARRLAALRKARNQAGDTDGADPLSTLREAAIDSEDEGGQGPADPFGPGRSGRGG